MAPPSPSRKMPTRSPTALQERETEERRKRDGRETEERRKRDGNDEGAFIALIGCLEVFIGHL